jgi:hypothetical protein
MMPTLFRRALTHSRVLLRGAMAIPCFAVVTLLACGSSSAGDSATGDAGDARGSPDSSSQGPHDAGEAGSSTHDASGFSDVTAADAAADVSLAADSSSTADAQNTLLDATPEAAASGTCTAGAVCTAGDLCGTFDGMNATACSCSSGVLVCASTPSPMQPCPADPMTLLPCNGMANHVLCVTVNGSGCELDACDGTGFGSWGGPCQDVVTCPASPPLCGTMCAEPIGGCSCQTNVFDTTPLACSCVDVGAQSAWICP